MTSTRNTVLDTLPETNIAPENGGPLEKEIPIGNHHFQGRTVSFREGTTYVTSTCTISFFVGVVSFIPGQ